MPLVGDESADDVQQRFAFEHRVVVSGGCIAVGRWREHGRVTDGRLDVSEEDAADESTTTSATSVVSSVLLRLLLEVDNIALLLRASTGAAMVLDQNWNAGGRDNNDLAADGSLSTTV